MDGTIPLAEICRHCPRCGRSTVGTCGHRVSCSACGHVHFANPAVAVAGLVVDDRGGMLFLVRAHEPARGTLAVPGGFIDPGERAEDALRREAREETGLVLETAGFLGTFPNVYHYAGVRYDVLDLYFVCRVPDLGGVVPGDEVAGVVIRDPGSVDDPELAFPSLRAALRAYRER